MSKQLTRRAFLRRSGGAAATATLAAAAGPLILTRSASGGPAAPPSERLGIGIIGTGGRGQFLMRKVLSGDLADIVAVCDADQANQDAAADVIAKKQQREPKKITDFRKLLEMKEVQAAVIATPDHWHAIQTILACQAGKDVYIEKPIAHNIAEGMAMVKAVRDSKRICSVGLMQRSGEDFKKAMAYAQSGKLGKVAFARAWYVKKRASLGNPPDSDPPKGLDWDMWVGPAPMTKYNPARCRLDLPAEGGLYGSWRWFWDYAGGQLLDWGPHMMDVVRWGLGLKMPGSAAAGGGKFVFDDCRECPDTLNVVFEYPGLSVLWEHRQWTDRAPEPAKSHGIEFYGSKGTLIIDRLGWEVVPEADGEKVAPIASDQQQVMDEEHLRDFVECCKSRKEPVAPIEEGFMTTATCQMGNMSFRSGAKVVWDDEKQTIVDNAEAMKFFGREHRAPWTLPA